MTKKSAKSATVRVPLSEPLHVGNRRVGWHDSDFLVLPVAITTTGFKYMVGCALILSAVMTSHLLFLLSLVIGLPGSMEIALSSAARHPEVVLIILLIIGIDIVLLAAGVGQLWDCFRHGPILILEREGIRDLRRSPELIPWAAIAKYRVERLPRLQNKTGMTLFLREPAPPASSRLQSGVSAIARFSYPKSDRVYVGMWGLSVPCEQLIYAAEYLIKEHGGSSTYR